MTYDVCMKYDNVLLMMDVSGEMTQGETGKEGKVVHTISRNTLTFDKQK